MDTINLKNLEIEMVDGSFIVKDVSKEIANLIYQNTNDIGMLDVAMTLYKEGSITMNEDQKKIFKNIIDLHIKAFVKKAIFKLL